MAATLTGWRAYATARGDDAVTAAQDTPATAALTRGRDHVRMRYAANLLGSYAATDFTPTGHDLPLQDEATYIAASLELATPGFFSTTYTPDQQKVLTKVSEIGWTPIASEGRIYGAMPHSAKLDALFEPYVLDRNRPGMALLSIGGAKS